MNHSPYKFSQIFIDEEVRNDDITGRVIRHFPKIEPNFVKYGRKFQEFLSGLSLNEGKRTLWLTRFKGNFLKPCPGTDTNYRCCNYLVINETTNCPIDCTYCILQGYINNPAITIYTNTQKITDEITAVAGLNPQRILRIGTGELTDSLALDRITRLSELLIDKIQQFPNLLLELKSKTDNIDHLLALNPERVVLSWSVNPADLVHTDEHKSSTISARLEAAKRAVRKGFLIGLHFDPVIYIPGWQQRYTDLIGQIAEKADGKRIAWISLGSLRYPAHLKEIIRNRFPKSRIFSGEQIKGMDGKMRYLRPLRKSMYQTIHQELHKKLGNVFVYFCMESESMWQEVLSLSPSDNNNVDFLFATNLYNNFPELKLPRPVPEVYRDEIRFTHQDTSR